MDGRSHVRNPKHASANRRDASPARETANGLSAVVLANGIGQHSYRNTRAYSVGHCGGRERARGIDECASAGAPGLPVGGSAVVRYGGGRGIPSEETTRRGGGAYPSPRRYRGREPACARECSRRRRRRRRRNPYKRDIARARSVGRSVGLSVSQSASELRRVHTRVSTKRVVFFRRRRRRRRRRRNILHRRVTILQTENNFDANAIRYCFRPSTFRPPKTIPTAARGQTKTIHVRPPSSRRLVRGRIAGTAAAVVMTASAADRPVTGDDGTTGRRDHRTPRTARSSGTFRSRRCCH